MEFDHLVFTPKTESLLCSQVFTVFEKPDACREMNVFPQRKILFEGPYGSGKTSAMLLSAKKAIERGWTVVFMPPSGERNIKSMEAGLSLAKKYQPSVFVMEDVDHEHREHDPYTFRQILSNLDGIISKGSRMVVLMSTNFKEKIKGGLLRPGRTDEIVSFGPLGFAGLCELVQRCVGSGKLDPAIDWSEVYDASREYTPAFVKEMATSAALQAVSADVKIVTQEMLIDAARNLRFQFDETEKARSTGQYL